MHPFDGIIGPLNVLVSCALQAVEVEPGSPPYTAQLHSAERAAERATAQVRRLTKGQPKHRKNVRTVAAIVEVASECVHAIRMRAEPEELVRRAGALQRAVARVTELTVELGRQREERSGEVIIGERPWTELLNAPNDLLSGEGSQSVEHDAGDETASVAALGASDQDPSAP